jgi:hypothetical protein
VLAGLAAPAPAAGGELPTGEAKPVLGRLEPAEIPRVGGLEATEVPRVGELEIASLEVAALKTMPLYSSRSGDVPVDPAGASGHLVIEVPVSRSEPVDDPDRTRWISEPFSTAGWNQVTVLVRVRRLDDGAVYTTYATRLDVRNAADMPFFHGGGNPLGASVVAAEGRAAYEHFTDTVEVVGFSVYLSR